MTVNNSTANRGYQLPHPSNFVSDDVNRLIAAFNAIDADVAAAILAIAGKAATGHGHLINDVAGLQAALDGKMSASARLAIAALSDVDVSGIAQNMFLRWNGSKWVPVAFDAGMIAGGTVADARLPSRLTASALAAAYAAVGHGHSIAEVSGLQTALDGKAALASPALSGAPTAPTATGGTNTTQIATTAFVQSAISSSVSMTLLGELITYSGFSQTLSNLVLTGYKFVRLFFKGVSLTGATGQFTINGVNTNLYVNNGGAGFSGIIDIELSSGFAGGVIGDSSTVQGCVCSTGYSRSSTSITVGSSYLPFDAGLISIYGIK